MLIVARLLSGLGVGAVLVAAPMYIAEISPPALRGRMVTINQLFIVLGIFLAFASNYSSSPGELPVRLAAAAAPGGLELALDAGHRRVARDAYFFALLVVPESPRWLAMHGQLRRGAPRARARARRERSPNASSPRCRASLAHEARTSEAALRDLWAPQLRGVLFIGLVVGILQQITGINSVLAYATVIFERAGAGANASSFVQTVFVGW